MSSFTDFAKKYQKGKTAEAKVSFTDYAAQYQRDKLVKAKQKQKRAVSGQRYIKRITDPQNIIDLGYGPISNKTLDSKILSGEVVRSNVNGTPQYFNYKDIVNFANKTANATVQGTANVMDAGTKATKEDKEEERTWFKGSEYFEDGSWDKGDFTKALSATTTHMVKSLIGGVLDMAEPAWDGLVNAFTEGSTPTPEQHFMDNAGLFSNYGERGQKMAEDLYKKEKAAVAEAREDLPGYVAQDLYDGQEVANKIIVKPYEDIVGIDVLGGSVLGKRSESLAASGGQMLATAGLNAIGVPWFLTTGITAYGSQAEEAYKEGATIEEATFSATVSAIAEVGVELLSGGIKFKLPGQETAKTLDDILLKPFLEKVTNKAVRKFFEFGIDALGEGGEEVLSGFISNFGSSIYKLDEETLGQILFSEEACDEYLEGLIGGMVLGGSSSAVKIVVGGKTVELTEVEKKVYEAVSEERIAEATKDGKKLTNTEENKIRQETLRQLQKGYISTDTIERVLGGEEYENYKKQSDSDTKREAVINKTIAELQQEYNELNKLKRGDMTGEQIDRQAEIKKQIEAYKAELEQLKGSTDTKNLKAKLSENVYGIVKDSRLAESYNEKTRRSQAFTADLSKYDVKQQVTVKKAIESGILNNTNRTHDFVDMIAKISADKGVSFDFINNQKLKDSGLALEGKTVNGYVTGDGNIAVNIDSGKALNAVVGHEVAHILEGTELYNGLSQAIIEYAKSKGEYQKRLAELSKLYEGVENADVEAELIADLVGDYLFTDSDFVSRLLEKNPSLFKKIFNEIKYLCKVATAGSKEAKQLEKVKRTFEKVYRETKAEKNTAEGVRYQITPDMTEQQRFEVLKDKKIQPQEIEIDSRFNDENIDIEYLEKNIKSIVEKPLIKKLKELGYIRKYQTSVIDVDFDLTVGGIRKSLNSQASYYGGNNADFTKIILNLQKLLDNSVLIDVHSDKGKGTSRNNPQLKQTYVMLSAFNEGNVTKPVQFEVMQYVDNNNRLYLAVALTKIETSVMGNTMLDKNQASTTLVPISNISLTDFFSKINPKDRKFLKYVPNQFLNQEQIEAKNIALREDAIKYGKEISNTSSDLTLSLSSDNPTPQKYGNYNVYGDDVRYQPDDIAPVREDLQAAKPKAMTEDIVPVREDIKQDLLSRSAESFGITKPGDYVQVQRQVFDTLNSEGFFSDKESRSRTVTNNDSSMQVEINKKGIKETFNYENYGRFSREYKGLKLATVRMLPQIIESGKLISDNINNYHNAESSVKFAYIESVVQVNGKDVSVKVDIKKSPQKNKFWVHSVEIKEKVDGLPVNESKSLKRDYIPNNSANSISKSAENVNSEDIAPVREDITPIKTVEERISAKIKNYQEEMANNMRLREKSNADFDERIADAQSKYEAMKNKNTKAANNILRRIETLKRRKNNIDADFSKKISDIEAGIARQENKLMHYQEGLNKEQVDRLERFRKRLKAHLESDIDLLIEEYEQKKASLQEEIKDKNAFISNKAKVLYDEIVNMRKGVRVSKEAGYFLDFKFDRSELKSTLLKVSRWPDTVLNPESEIESIVREAVGRDYESKQEALSKIENELTKEIKKLEDDAEKKLENFERANRRMTKQAEIEEQMAELIGDTSTWVDKKTGLQYKVNTLRRNLRDVVRDSKGKRDIVKADRIYDELQGKYNKHEAELFREANKIKSPFAEKKITKAEDKYIQMLGELRSNPDTTLSAEEVEEFYEAHKQQINTEKVESVIKDAREVYDKLLVRVNEVLKEHGMREIPRREGYFPHFTEEKQGFLGKFFNWKTQNNNIPTDIAGMTEKFNPIRSWQAFNKPRIGDDTVYSFAKGFDTYVHGALDWIYHIEDLQKRRAFENYIRYIHSEAGIKEQINAIKNNEEYDADTAQSQIELVYQNARNPLNNFVTDFRTATNTLAGKKSSMDRGMEEATNRKVYSTMTNISNRVSANMVAGSISSALTNFIPITQSWGQVSPISSLRAMKQTIASTFRDDGAVDKSDFLTTRLRSPENLYRTTWDKIGDKVGWLMESIDSFTSQTVWRSKYIENISKCMSESEAIKNADQFAENVIAGRSRGNNPTAFDTKNILWKTLTAFQLEVNNQYGYMFKDMPQDMANESKTKLVKGYATMFIGAYVYNALYSSIVGRDAAFDPVGIIEEVLQDLGLIGDDWLPKEIIEALGLADEDDEEEEEIAPFDAAGNFVRNITEELPFIGGLVGGGRIPLSSALPYGSVTELYEGTKQDLEDKNIVGLTKEWLKPIYYLVMPMGGGQLKKTVEGLQMFDDDFPVAGSYTDSGSLRFPVEETPENILQAFLFGQYANKNAQTYFDEGYAPLKEKQIEEYKELDVPIADYWKYREGLSGLKTLNEKGDYIGGLDLSVEKKNLLINNIAGRETPIDMTDYHKYSDFEEFDFATRDPEKYSILKKYGMPVEEYLEHREVMSKIEPLEGKEQVTLNQKGDYIGNLDLPINKKNALINCVADRDEPIDMTDYHKYSDFQEFDFATRYPEKYKVLQEQGLSVKEYKEKYEESVFMYTDDFSWAANNPEQYAVSKAVSDDVTEYKKYTADLYNIKADKDKNGKSISGSRKKKVVDYINGLNIDYGAKIILFKKEYSSDDTYNMEILEYLNSRSDITYTEKVTILTELGFDVDSDGRVTW